MKKPFTLIFFLTLQLFAFSQNGEIVIRYIGNCGLHITDGAEHIYVDFPYKSGAHDYMEFDSEELEIIHDSSYFIFTHTHSDHFSRKNLKTVMQAKGGEKFGTWNAEELSRLNQQIPDFSIEAIRTRHLFTFRHYSYLITWHGKRIYISGDTEKSDILASQKNLDLVFMPAWTALDAHEKAYKIDAPQIVIYHIGPKDKVNITGPKVQMLGITGELIRIPF